MLKLLNGLFWLSCGIISLPVFANQMDNSSPTAEEVTIPGYSPPSLTEPKSTSKDFSKSTPKPDANTTNTPESPPLPSTQKINPKPNQENTPQQ